MYYLAQFAYKYFFSQHIPVIARKQINKNAQEISALLFFFSHTSLPSFFFIFLYFQASRKLQDQSLPIDVREFRMQMRLKKMSEMAPARKSEKSNFGFKRMYSKHLQLLARNWSLIFKAELRTTLRLNARRIITFSFFGWERESLLTVKFRHFIIQTTDKKFNKHIIYILE